MGILDSLPLSFTSEDPFTLTPDMLYGGFGGYEYPYSDLPLGFDSQFNASLLPAPMSGGDYSYIDPSTGMPVYGVTAHAGDYPPGGPGDQGFAGGSQQQLAGPSPGNGADSGSVSRPTFSVTGYGVDVPPSTIDQIPLGGSVPLGPMQLPNPVDYTAIPRPDFSVTGTDVYVPPSLIGQLPVQPGPIFQPPLQPYVPPSLINQLPMPVTPSYLPNITAPSRGGGSGGSGGKKGSMLGAAKYSAPKPGPMAPVVGSRGPEPAWITPQPPVQENPISKWYPYLMWLLAQNQYGGGNV